ncbi:MAG: HAD-IB family hydrolase [Candidatus Helarchaeota archaeon]|nr:HAD-IB family hydrolase [Candidatus Helarchaeota archaeon]
MQKAAIFDLDGTLIPGKSTEIRFIEHLFKKGELNPIDILWYLLRFLQNIGRWNRMVSQNKYYLKGKSFEKLSNIANEFFLPTADKLVPGEMKRIIQTHRENGDLLIIISGTLNFILNIFSNSFSFDDKKGTELEVKDGKFTGKLSGIHPSNNGKVVVLNEFVTKYNIDLANSTAYGNHYGDRFLMEMVGNPIAVNPDRKLLKYAKSKKWKILEIR